MSGDAGEVIELRPHAVVAGGDAIARADDGRIVFVSGALPDEVVRAEVFGKSRDYLRARLLDVVEGSPLRVEPPCPEVARGCGSCQWQHISTAGQRALKTGVIKDSLRRLGGVAEPILEPIISLSATGYRTTIRAAVTEGRAGYRQARHHDVVEIETCGVAHPLIEDLLVNSRFGAADEVVLRCGARTGERLVAADPPGSRITVPPDVRRDFFHEQLGDRRWRISANSFFQTRPDGAEVLISLVAAAVSGRKPGVGVDLYGGVGLFARVLADRGWSVKSVESSKVAVADAKVNLAKSGVEVVRADVNRWRGGPADLVVADPSRKGLGTRGVATVAATGASRVVLVSCDAAAFGRDTKLLSQAGYSLTSVAPIDMFPHTFHVEIVSVFDLGPVGL